MKLIEAILSSKPFRRPSWVNSEDLFQWVIINHADGYFDWAEDTGEPSGNVFGSLEQIVQQNGEVEDYEIKE